MTETSTLMQILVLIGVATLVATFFRHLKIPTVVGFILAGVLAGPSGLGLVPSIPGASVLNEWTILLLMFAIGLEVSIQQLWELRKNFIGAGFLQIIGTIFLVEILGWFIPGVGLSKSIFFGFLVALSSTAIVIKLLEESRDLRSPHGNLSFGILLFQDLAVIPLMLALPLFVPSSEALAEIDWAKQTSFLLGKIVLLVGIVWGGSNYLVPFLLQKVVKTKSRELFFFSIAFICLGAAFLVEELGGSLSLGAFVAGLMISESPYGRQVASDIVPLRDSFLGLFFVSIGMILDISFVAAHVHWILLLVLAVIAVKSVVIIGLSRFLHLSRTVVFVCAIILCQIGEFSFVLAKEGLTRGILNQQELQYFLAVSVLTMILTPFLYQWIFSKRVSRNLHKLHHFMPLEEIPTKNPIAGGHAIIIGFGVAGQNLANVFDAVGIPYTVIEMNYDIVQDQNSKKTIFYGDATSSVILEHAGIRNARMVAITVSGSNMTQGVLSAIRGIRPDIQIIVRAQYYRDARDLKDLGSASVIVAEFETTLEIVAQALMMYGVSSTQIHELMMKTRKELDQSVSNLVDSVRRTVTLPAWEALSAIRPIRVEKDSFACSKKISELNLRQKTGASIVVIFREGLGTTIPSPDLVVESGDVLHVIGSREALASAEKFVWFGK